MRTAAALLLAVLVLFALPVAAQEEATPSPAPDPGITPAETTPGPTPALSPPDTFPMGPVVQAPPPSLDVSVEPASVTFGSAGVMLVPVSYHAWVNVTVQATGTPAWFLRAEDLTPGTAHRGFLSSASPARNLTRPLEIWDFTLVPETFRPVGSGNTVWYSSTKPGKSEVVTRFRQQTTTDDLYGVYAMTVSFTASTS